MSGRADPPAVLVVDDDELVTTSLKSLLELETDYDVAVFTKPEQALAEAGRRRFDVVVSDFLMPGLNGVELLKRLREIQPDAARILLTGFADKENAIRAINEAGLYQYVEKPWDNDRLLLMLRHAVSENSLRGRLRDKIAEFERLIAEHSRLTGRHQTLARDLESAAEIQRGLLPGALPRAERFEVDARVQPSATLGGDFHDAHERGDAVVYMLADVSGHGTQAALSSMLLKAVFHEAARSAADPAEILAGMNDRLCRFLPASMFACVAVVWIARDATAPVVANAGLPRPIVLRAAAGRADEMPIAGMPLGIFGDPPPGAHDVREVSLDPGDALLLHTDGLVEIRDGEGRFLRESGVRTILADLVGLRADRLNERLLERARAFSQEGGFSDDVSLLCIRSRLES